MESGRSLNSDGPEDRGFFVAETDGDIIRPRIAITIIIVNNNDNSLGANREDDGGEGVKKTSSLHEAMVVGLGREVLKDVGYTKNE